MQQSVGNESFGFAAPGAISNHDHLHYVATKKLEQSAQCALVPSVTAFSDTVKGKHQRRRRKGLTVFRYDSYYRARAEPWIERTYDMPFDRGLKKLIAKVGTKDLKSLSLSSGHEIFSPFALKRW